VVKPWKWGDPLPQEAIRALVIYMEMNRLIADWVNLPLLVAIAFKDKGQPEVSLQEAAKEISRLASARVKPRTIERILSGDTLQPKVNTIRIIAAALEIPFELAEMAANPFRRHPEELYHQSFGFLQFPIVAPLK
jgi:hypothetical protein